MSRIALSLLKHIGYKEITRPTVINIDHEMGVWRKGTNKTGFLAESVVYCHIPVARVVQEGEVVAMIGWHLSDTKNFHPKEEVEKITKKIPGSEVNYRIYHRQLDLSPAISLGEELRAGINQKLKLTGNTDIDFIPMGGMGKFYITPEGFHYKVIVNNEENEEKTSWIDKIFNESSPTLKER